MLAVLFDHKKIGKPFVTIIIAGSCLLVSVPTFFFPQLYRVFGGLKPLNFFWQKYSLSFQHGFDGFPLILHLGGNLLLLCYCGVFSEKILGAARFLLLTVAAMLVFAGVHSLPWLEGHGSSGIIWAYSPIVFTTLIIYRKSLPVIAESDSVFQRGIMILIIMWGVITILMTILPYLVGGKGNLFIALILGNIFHAAAVAIGFLFSFLWRNVILNKFHKLAVNHDLSVFQHTFIDKLAIALSLLIPVNLLVILILVAVGKIAVK
ncbi:MAG: hypothetical protein ACE5HS_20365 [bacterium]